MSNIRRLDDLEKPKVPEGYEEFTSQGGSSSTTMLRPVQRDANHMLIREGAAPSSIVITLYNNGFLVNNGPFRPISDPANQEFLATVQAGEVPPELEKLTKGTEESTAEKIAIQLVVKKEDYSPPPPTTTAGGPQGFDFAQNAGRTLLDAPLSLDLSLSLLPAQELVATPGEPTVVIQLVLVNRKRVRLTVNPSTTVAQIYQHVSALDHGVDAETNNWVLAGGFPVKELNDGSATVAALKLGGTAVTQRALPK